MPKSKPPRRRYRPLRRISDFDERAMAVYDQLEDANNKFEQQVTPFLEQIPAKERSWLLAKFAENRALFAECRADILTPSPTPVLDGLLREDAARRGMGR